MSDKANLRRSAATVALIASAAELGYNTRAGFQTAVASAAKLVPSNYLDLVEKKDDRAKAFTATIQAFGDEYKAGHVVAYLEPHMTRRWSNLDRGQRVAEAKEILAKPEPTSDKSNRRTETEHKACRAAISAWSHLKGEAGLKAQTASKTNRKGANQKRRAAGDEKPVPAARLQAPKFIAPIDAVKFYQGLADDLLKAVNSNAMATPIAIKSAVQDFRKAIREAAALLKAGQKRTAKARTAKGTVSAATIASQMQNGTGKPNGASVQ